MSGLMFGADAEELEQIALELEGYEDELGHLLSQGVGSVALLGLSATLNSIWAGPRASEFGGLWQSRHLLRIRDVQSMLREAAADLRRNAEEQRRTSSISGGGGGRGPLTPHEREVLERFQQNTDDAGEDPAAYWQGLTDYEKQILIHNQPDWVLTLLPLGALSQAETEAARESWRSNVGDEFDVTESYVEYYFDAEIDVKLYSAGLEGSAAISEVRGADGNAEYKVAFSVEGDIAKSGFGMEAGGYVEYRFETMEEARTFQEGLANRLVPDGGDVAWALVPFVGGNLVVANTASDVKEFADAHSSNRTSARISAGVQASMELDGKDVEVDAKVSGGAFYDAETGERGFYLDGSAGLDVELGRNFEFDAEFNATGDIVWDKDGQPSELTMGFEVSATGSLELEGALQDLLGDSSTGPLLGLGDEIEGNFGAGASVQMKLDLSSPRNQALADAFVAGDVGVLTELVANSEVVIQAGVVGVNEHDIDFKVGELEYGRRNYENLVTLGKPPNSGFEAL